MNFDIIYLLPTPCSWLSKQNDLIAEKLKPFTISAT